MQLTDRFFGWFAKGVQKRMNLVNPDPWFTEWLGGRGTAAGVRVGSESALAYSAYFAAIRNISEDVSKLPLNIYRQLTPRGKELESSHPINMLLNAPNPDMTTMSFRETLTAHALGWQGGFAEIQRDREGRAVGLYPLDPRRVTVRQVTDGRRDLANFAQPGSAIFYEVSRETGGTVILPATDVLHLRGLGYDGITSFVIANVGREAIGAALAAQQHGASFFGKGTVATGVLQTPQVLSDKAMEHLRDSFAARHGGPSNAWKPIVLEEGVEWNQTSSTAEDAQLVETRGFDVTDVARWFRIPPHKLQQMDRATFSNIEHQSIEYVTDTITPWLVRWEQEISRKLLPQRSQLFFPEHRVAALLRGDMAARSAFYREQFHIGALSPNDIRDLENLNPIPGGDEYFVNSATITLEAAAEGVEPPAPEMPQEPDTDDEPDDDAEAARGLRRAHAGLMASRLAHLYRAEVDKVKRKRKSDNGSFLRWSKQWYSDPDRVEQVRGHLGPVVDAFFESLEVVGVRPGVGFIDACSGICGRYVMSVRRKLEATGELDGDESWIGPFCHDELAQIGEVQCTTAT